VTQVGYVGDNTPLIGGSYGIAFAYTYSQNLGLPIATPLAALFSDYYNAGTGYTSANNYGLSGYWKPSKSGIIPSISWGVGSGSYNIGAANGNGQLLKGLVVSSWYTGLQWDDAFINGNAAGMGVGQAPFVTQYGSNTSAGTPGAIAAAGGYGATPNDSNYMWEWWYKFQVTDNISITPAIFYISNYDGAYGKLNLATGANTASDNLFGGVVKTTFKF